MSSKTITSINYAIRTGILSDPQAEILLWQADGETRKGAARILNITEKVAQGHQRTMLAAMGVETLAAAVAKGFATGMIRPR